VIDQQKGLVGSPEESGAPIFRGFGLLCPSLLRYCGCTDYCDGACQRGGSISSSHRCSGSVYTPRGTVLGFLKAARKGSIVPLLST